MTQNNFKIKKNDILMDLSLGVHVIKLYILAFVRMIDTILKNCVI